MSNFWNGRRRGFDAGGSQRDVGQVGLLDRAGHSDQRVPISVTVDGLFSIRIEPASWVASKTEGIDPTSDF